MYERAAANGKRVQALGGAKNYMVVMPDAVMDKTVDNIIGSAFGAAGQRCMAGSVIVTVGDAKKPLLDLLKERTESLHVGDGMVEGSDVGPLVSRTARDRVSGWIDKGVQEGATVLVDGRSPEAPTPTARSSGRRSSTTSRPTWRSPARRSSGRCCRSSTPSRSTTRSRSSTAAATATARRSSPSRAPRSASYRHDIEVGMVGVNIGVAAPVAFFPFSGWKDSFFGDLHAHGTDAVDFYTRKKTVTSRFFSGGETGKFFVEQGERR